MKYLIPIDGLREMMLKPLLVQILGDVGKMLGQKNDIFMTLKDEPLRLVRSPNGNIEDNRLYSLRSTGELPNDYIKLESFEFAKFNDEIYDNQYYQTDSQPILEDYEFSVTPVYRTSELNMTLRYYSNDKAFLQRSIDQFLVTLFRTQGKYTHTLDMRYPLGRRLSLLLIEIFKIKAKTDVPELKALLKKELGGLGDEEKVKLYFTDYLKTVSGRRIHLFANDTKRSGKRKGRGISVGVKEKQRVVTGMVITNLDRLEVDEEDNRYYVEFEYSINFEHPYGYNVKQPIMVYNTLLPKVLRDVKAVDGKPDFNFSTNFYTNVQGVLEPIRSTLPGKTRSFTIPEIDLPGGVERTGTMNRLFSRLVQVKYDKEKKLVYAELDIRKIGFETDLEPFDLKEEIIDFILNSEREYVTKFDRSLFFFTLTEGNEQFSSIENLTLSKDGKLRSIKPLDVRKTYRICMYVRMDNLYVYKQDKARILEYLRKQERELDSDSKVHEDNFAFASVNGGILYAPYEIRKRYLSTLNLLLLSYKLTPDQIKAIKRYGYTRENAIFYIKADALGFYPAVQIYHTEILRRVGDETK